MLILGRILLGIAGGFSSSNFSLLVAQDRFLFIRIVQCSGLMSSSLLEDCLNNSNLRQLHPLPRSLEDSWVSLWLLSHRGTEDCRLKMSVNRSARYRQPRSDKDTDWRTDGGLKEPLQNWYQESFHPYCFQFGSLWLFLVDVAPNRPEGGLSVPGE